VKKNRLRFFQFQTDLNTFDKSLSARCKSARISQEKVKKACIAAADSSK
jgi:hypothetical protein